MERILIITNKSWEADAALSAMFNADFYNALPAAYKNFNGLSLQPGYDFPRSQPQGAATPRAIYKTADLSIEIWCLNNVMTPSDNQADYFYYSRDSQKAKDFHKILDYSGDAVKLVIAVGTAGAPTEVSKNGGIVIGSGVFPYNSGKETTAPYQTDQFGKLVTSTVPDDLFNQLNIALATIDMKLFFESALLSPPGDPSSIPFVIADKNIVAISDMNVSSYDDFDTCDPLAVKAFSDLKKANKLVQTAYSVETTHCLMRLESPCDNFMFISLITDRSKYFDTDDASRPHAQNFSASFNGGVFLCCLVPFLAAYYK